MDFNDDENIEWLMESSKTVERVVEDEKESEKRERQSKELCDFLNVLRSVFESEPILYASKASGTVITEEDVQKLIKKLQAFGYFFNVRSSCKKLDKESKVMTLAKKTPPSRHPYKVNNYTRYYCSLGRNFKNRMKESQEEFIEGSEKQNLTSREQNGEISAETDKNSCRSYKECRAMMDIKQIEVYTHIDLPENRRHKVQVLDRLRRSLARGFHPGGSIRHNVSISLPGTHNHPRALQGHRLHEEVKAAMHSLLQGGPKTAGEVRQQLARLVEKEFETDIVKPVTQNSAFYPSEKVIYNHLRNEGLQRRVNRKKQMAKMKSEVESELERLAEWTEVCEDREILQRTLHTLRRLNTLHNPSKTIAPR